MNPFVFRNDGIASSRSSLGRLTVEIATTIVGAALVVCAVAANQSWLDRHFLPSFFMPRDWYVRLETFVRLAVGATGVSLALLARRPIGRVVGTKPGLSAGIGIAAVLALGASELVIRGVDLRPTEWLLPEEEPRRRPDPRLGWVLAPARTGSSVIGGRTIEYAIDPAGYRVRRLDEPVDPAPPTLLFTGESVMFGEGLAWDETVPAQVGAMLGIQTANLAVHGYSTDQAYLRLETELPRFRQPVAIVTLFMTALFGRNLDDDRPHLGPGLVWLPAEHASRLAALAGLLVPYRTDATVRQGIQVTREVLRATVELARARGAQPLVVIPQLGPEAPSERVLRHRIVDEAGVPSVLVEIDPEWHLRWDRHPNARGAHAIAGAIAAQLEKK